MNCPDNGPGMRMTHELGLYVDWHLLDGCNHDCEYNHEPPRAAHERFSRENLLTAAYRLLRLNRPEYIVRLYGGEPTIHPYFPELFAYLAASGRNTRLLLETNGLRSLDYYTRLLRNAPRGRVCALVDVHPQYMDLQRLLLLLAHLLENGQFCRVRINHVPAYADKARLLCEKLAQFRKRLPFALEPRFPLGGHADWLPELRRRFNSPALPPLEMPVWADSAAICRDTSSDVIFAKGAGRKESGTEPVSAASPAKTRLPCLTANGAAAFVCLGVNGMHITPDGTHTLGLRGQDQPFAPRILEHAALRAGMPPPPSFADRAGAQAWLAAFRARSLRHELDGGPLRHPLRREMDEEQRVRARLKRLKPAQKPESSCRNSATAGSASLCRDAAPACPELWRESREDVPRVHARLADEDSRTVFLRLLKARLLGDGGYLADSPYALFSHPALLAADGFRPSPEDPGCRLLRMTEHVTPEAVNALLPRLQWYRPALELVLPEEPWLAVLLQLCDALPDYRIFLGQHGAQSVAYAAPRTPRKRYRPVPLRTMDGRPLVSILLPAFGAAEALSRSLESALALPLPRCEIIVVQDAPAAARSSLVDAFARRDPWRVRPFRFETPLSLNAAWDAGLDMAQGDYLCFLRCGDIPEDSLALAVDALEQEKADVAVLSPCVASGHRLDGRAALTRFLTGQLGNDGVTDKVYRASLIRDQAAVLADLPGELEDAIFNLSIFFFARKVLCLPGKLAGSRSGDGRAGPEEGCRAFFAALDALARFCAAHDLAVNSPEIRAWILRAFSKARPSFISAAAKAGGLEALLDEKALRALSLTPDIAHAVCAELAPLRCEAGGSAATLCPAPAPALHSRYAGAAEGFQMAYPLSVIVTVEDGASLLCLERLAEEECGLVQCLIVDNAAAEETAAALAAFADMCPNFRLCRMENTATAAQCLNAGLELAGGEAVACMDSGDEPMPEFVRTAAQAIRSGREDIIVFGAGRLDADGAPHAAILNGGICSGRQAAALFFEKGIPPDTAGMLFRREYLLREQLAFNPLAPEWNADFVLRALRGASVRLRPSTACIRRGRNAAPACPSLYPGSPQAARALYALLQEFVEQGEWNEAAQAGLQTWLRQSLKKTWLPLYTAHARENDAGPLTTHELMAAPLPSLLLRSLFREYAETMDSE